MATLSRKAKAQRRKKQLIKEYNKGWQEANKYTTEKMRAHHQRIYDHLVEKLRELEGAENVLLSGRKDDEFMQVKFTRHYLTSLIATCYESYQLGYELCVKRKSKPGDPPQYTGTTTSSGIVYLDPDSIKQ